ncbi:MAG: 3-deoxy-7-phosphoheptulonate synthase, partial [Erysipelotrichia bacterium]|nr:3-deoxy-7-phosphoheptulonate synthase [Erysipelotrichia bacterium]
MIITLKKNAPQLEVDRLIQGFERIGLQVHMIYGDNYNVFGLVGDTTQLDERDIMASEWVENVQRVQAPYKLANRTFHPADTIVDVGGIPVGGHEKIVMIAGPCSVEGKEPLIEIAEEVKEAGAGML